ncbi:hypothetical protein [Microbulbifer sp. VAAF005]|uniref:hypothetical protein n=1 Tax=Microbulbifer sp. VAAF005 TaxID=3034230 RepID=UPI0024ADE343|nr:hypothetical protein [Microbulbifer sp. VAAF005]WHI45614.1 hypothetical protein P0078_18050 [Microbulbifer sp. VAAF005]
MFKKAFSITSGAVALSVFSVQSHAYLECGYIDVKGITVQATRDNGSAYADTLRIFVNSQGDCEGVKYAYLENSEPSYPSILSTLLSAQASGKKVSVNVKESSGISSDAHEIEWISIWE